MTPITLIEAGLFLTAGDYQSIAWTGWEKKQEQEEKMMLACSPLRSVVATIVLALCGLPLAAHGAVTPFADPDGQLETADPTRDLAFQAALTLPFTEFDFATFGHEYILDPSPLFAGAANVRPNLLDAAGNDAADLSLNGGRLIETFPFIPDIPGIIGGGGGGAALLNRVFSGAGPDAIGAAIEFTFSEPVEGFGTWIMDDVVEANGFVLKITEVGGATYTSPLMESGNGADLAIEGFLGAVSDVGIVRAVVEQQTVAGVASNADFFYLDHVQVGGVIPEPSTLILAGFGAFVATRRRRW